MTFALLVDRAFGALAQYASADMIAGRRFLHALGDVALACEDRSRIATLRTQVQDFHDFADTNLSGANRRSVLERADALLRALDDDDYKRRLRDSDAWLGGSA